MDATRKLKKYLIRAHYELEENEDIDAAIFLIDDAILMLAGRQDPFKRDRTTWLDRDMPVQKKRVKRKVKLSAYNKFVKANASKPRFKYKSGSKKGRVNMKKLAQAWKKTTTYKK
jgi:hypothetical protein